MNSFFSFVGKAALLLIVVGLIGAGGYYLGTVYTKNKEETSIPKTPSPSPTSTPSTNNPTASISPSLSPRQGTSKGFVASDLTEAGMAGGPGTSRYTIKVPEGWYQNLENEPGVNKLTISKNGYKIVISQAAGGAGVCVYGSDPAEMMSQKFATYTDIIVDNRKMRRGSNPDIKTSQTVCEKKTGADYSFPTAFGYITYTTPDLADPSVLTEMDGILYTIVKK